jgi:hypothetical protein
MSITTADVAQENIAANAQTAPNHDLMEHFSHTLRELLDVKALYLFLHFVFDFEVFESRCAILRHATWMTNVR